MHQRSQLFWPAHILIGFVLLIGLMAASVAIAPLNVLAVDPFSECPTDGPAAQPNPYPPYPQCKETQVALQTGTAQSQNPGSNTNTPTTESSGGNNNTGTAATNTPTATLTPTATNGPPTGNGAATPTTTPTVARPTATTAPIDAAPSPTPTSILPPGIEARVCVPGEIIEITGEGTPGTPLIVTFDRRPVGGGAVRSNGMYRLTLRIGPERPGTYLVDVEERDTRFVLQQFGCEVPGGRR